MGSGPLSGVRILAVEQMIAAPWATQFLGRLGAEVIKIEHPTDGESGRSSVPAVLDDDGRKVGATFLRNNLNKRSVGVDLKRGAELVLALAEHCDVFVENFKAGALDRLGLGYLHVSARNPKIIYASVTGFGNATPSPYREWPAYAAVAEAMSGIYEWVRPPGGQPIINPVGGLGDIGSGMFAALGILAALRDRDRTGQGQHVDVSMFDVMVAIGDVVPSLSSLGITPENRIPGAILTTFAAVDGAVVAQVSREHQFQRLADLVGHPEWVGDARFATRQGWVDHLESVIRPEVEAWTRQHPKLEVTAAFAAAGIPAGPSNRPEDVLADPHLNDRGMLVHFESADGQDYVVPGNPVRLSHFSPPADASAPRLGADTENVLHELLGLDDAQVAAWRERGAIR